MENKIKRTIVVLLAVCFLMSTMAIVVSAVRSDTLEHSNSLKATNSLKASIHSDVNSGYVPFTVHFRATVRFQRPSGNRVAYFWDFGDGTYTTERNPVHTFNDQGDHMATSTGRGGMFRS